MQNRIKKQASKKSLHRSNWRIILSNKSKRLDCTERNCRVALWPICVDLVWND